MEGRVDQQRQAQSVMANGRVRAMKELNLNLNHGPSGAGVYTPTPYTPSPPGTPLRMAPRVFSRQPTQLHILTQQHTLRIFYNDSHDEQSSHSAITVIQRDRGYYTAVGTRGQNTNCRSVDLSDWHPFIAATRTSAELPFVGRMAEWCRPVERPYSITVCVNISETSEFHVVLDRNVVNRPYSVTVCVNISETSEFHVVLDRNVVNRPYSITVCVNISETLEFHVVIDRNVVNRPYSVTEYV
ncbi:hypothetical protein J6590_083097 [Homalodisca vitripennis]|nr:hypothetical protein J6590_083097 [Homalodisca vitripennis]